MEVDHFNPRKKSEYLQYYENLFLSTRHCNGAKKKSWPKFNERKVGMRFLNCCVERDYGLHIFEDPDTHELVGVTPAGIYHVRNCHLNAKHLVEERASRTHLLNTLNNRPVTLKKGWDLVAVAALRNQLEKMIPPIDFLSGKPLEEQRRKRAALAQLRAQRQNNKSK